MSLTGWRWIVSLILAVSKGDYVIIRLKKKSLVEPYLISLIKKKALVKHILKSDYAPPFILLIFCFYRVSKLIIVSVF